MQRQHAFSVPSELELTEWFGCVPLKDGAAKYRFEISDQHDVKLIFSFDAIEASIQTIVTVGGATVVNVVHESARKLWLQDRGTASRLRAECASAEQRTELTIQIDPRIHVEWSTLRRD